MGFSGEDPTYKSNFSCSNQDILKIDAPFYCVALGTGASRFGKQAFFIVLAQIKQVSGVGRLSSLAIKDYILLV